MKLSYDSDDKCAGKSTATRESMEAGSKESKILVPKSGHLLSNGSVSMKWSLTGTLACSFILCDL